MKILVVDDSRFSRKRIIAALDDQDHEILQAENGAEGFELFLKEQPDLVISDLLMPEVDGIEQLRRIRESGSSTPVIIVSADIQESSHEICQSFGIVSFLNKPFKPTELQQVISDFFAQKCEA